MDGNFSLYFDLQFWSPLLTSVPLLLPPPGLLHSWPVIIQSSGSSSLALCLNQFCFAVSFFDLLDLALLAAHLWKGFPSFWHLAAFRRCPFNPLHIVRLTTPTMWPLFVNFWQNLSSTLTLSCVGRCLLMFAILCITSLLRERIRQFCLEALLTPSGFFIEWIPDLVVIWYVHLEVQCW